MADKTGIQWTDATWNPIRGCSRVSQGCVNCYAEKVAARFSGPGGPYEGLVTDKGKWNGVVRTVPKHLGDPLRWDDPKMVFVNSMSDLFHESLSNEEIAEVFGVMAASKRHTFQVLTKRPERMVEWFAWNEAETARQNDPRGSYNCLQHAGMALPYTEWRKADPGRPPAWPLQNVWLGVSVENQETADKRIPLLMKCPAAVRWVSYEPALGPVSFAEWMPLPFGSNSPDLDWIVVGGESGPGARPFDLSWASSVIAQAGGDVPVFVKQMGSKPMKEGWAPLNLRDRKGGDMAEWPEELRVRQWPRGDGGEG